MQQAVGGGVAPSANGGGLGEPGKPGGLFGGGQKAQYSGEKADNINPSAPDCYFYYYSTCSKVSLSLPSLFLSNQSPSLCPPSLSQINLPLLLSPAQGGQCKFRHCSAALGTEEACDLWLRNQSCKRQICAFRHSVPEVS